MKILVSVGAEHSQQMRLKLMDFRDMVKSVSSHFAESEVEASSERSVKIIFNRELSDDEFEQLSSKLMDKISGEFNFAKGFVTISLV